MFPISSDRNMIGTRRQGQLRSERADEFRRDTHSVRLGSEAIEEPQCRKKQSVAGQLVVNLSMRQDNFLLTNFLDYFKASDRLSLKWFSFPKPTVQ